MQAKRTGKRNSRLTVEVAILLALTYVAHWSGQSFQIGGAQLAPSVAVYTLAALALASRLTWAALVATALLIGGLTMMATSSPFPAANIPAHAISFLLVAYVAKRPSAGAREMRARAIVLTVIATTFVSWTLYAVATWLGLSGTEFVEGAWSRFGLEFGRGLWAWWSYGFLGVAVPTAVVGGILAPVLHLAVRGFSPARRTGSL